MPTAVMQLIVLESCGKKLAKPVSIKANLFFHT